MRRDSEIVCPFCAARCPLMGTAETPFPFKGYGHFEVYRCPCGAVGLPSWDIGEDGWPRDHLQKLASKAAVEARLGDCDVDLDYVTHIAPPPVMLWAKRRLAPSG